LIAVLEAMVADEQQQLDRLQLLSPRERERVLVQFNDTQRAYSSERCVHELFEEQAQREPQAIAVGLRIDS